MTGQIIPFQGRRPLSAPTAAPVPTIERQMARIGQLVDELEGLTHAARDVPATTLVRAQMTLLRAHRLLAARLKEEGEPQPAVDRGLLERHYRTISPDKMGPLK